MKLRGFFERSRRQKIALIRHGSVSLQLAFSLRFYACRFKGTLPLGLSAKEESSGVKISNLSSFQSRCQASHDALDSVVAAVIASLWARDPSVFWCPDMDGPDEIASLEGWLYAPVYL